MQRSTDRMLTTHTGSLPQPSDLDAMLRAKEAGQPYVAEAVQQQAEHGLDIVDEAVLPAVAVGTVKHWLANAYYPSDEAFLFALADALHEEYTAIVQAGFLLQIDSPDLAMGWHTQFPDKTLEEFRTSIARRVEALNHALAGIPPERVRHHICAAGHQTYRASCTVGGIALRRRAPCSGVPTAS